MLAIRDTSVVPQRGWEYIVQPTNHPVVTRNYNMLYKEIVKHCVSNGIPVPTEQDVIRNLCDNLIIPCYETENSTPLINKFALGVPNLPSIGSCCR